MVDVDEDENVDRDTSTASEELEPNASCLSDESSFYGEYWAISVFMNL